MIQKYPKPGAVAWIQGDSIHPGIRGKVEFSTHPDGVQVGAEIRGLPESEAGFFALHIHDGASCNGTGFPAAGSHFNPGDLPHPRHAGDLPPLLSRKGSADFCLVTDRFTIPQILGKLVVIHSLPDDFRTQPSGAAGTKIACGDIHRT